MLKFSKMSLMKIVDEENKMLFKSHCQRGSVT